MNALLYIIRKSMINSLKELLKKPGKLIFWIFITAMFIRVIILSFSTKTQVEQPAPLFWFSGILFLFVTLFVVISVVKGLSSGDAIFEMSDVNLTFVSPISTRKVLLYGLLRMAKTSLAGGFFILFQSSSLANFGIDYGGVLLTFTSYVLSIVTLIISSLVIYSVTNGNPRRKLMVKLVSCLLFVPFAVYFIAQYFSAHDVVSAIQSTVGSPYFRFIPVAGWTAGGVTAFLSGEIFSGCVFFGMNLLLGAGMVAYIMLSNPDYYEDVLVASETVYEKKRAMAEGNPGAATQSKRPVKITKTGITGNGAAALFGKHMRENFRENRFGILTLPSVLIVTGAVVITFFIRNIFTVMQILMWCQIMLIGTGRGLKETFYHYIYMIPESSFKKILWSSMEIMARTLLESVMIFGIGGAIVRSNPENVLVCILTYTLFSLLLLGVNYVLMRFTGADVSAGLLVIIYFLAVVVAMLPGLALAIVIGSIIGGDLGFLSGVLVLAGWELAAGLGCFALASGVLHNCDMASLETRYR